MNDVLACPKCHSTELLDRGDAVSCVRCGGSFPRFHGIIDFRDVVGDHTAGLSMVEDMALSELLVRARDHVSTFNEMLELFEIVRPMYLAGEDIGALDIPAVMTAHGITPQPLRPGQTVHGAAILEKIAQYSADAGAVPPARGLALEAGAGNGLFAAGFANHFRRLIVLDIFMYNLVLTRIQMDELGLDNVTLLCANAERLPLRDDSVDFIHSNNVIEHVTEQQAIFTQGRRVLKLGGLLFVLSPNRFSLYFEPHFRLPGFGFWPKSLRRRIVWQRQKQNIDDVGLCSLGELKRFAARAFGSDYRVSFIPRRLQKTVMGGLARRVLVGLLNTPLLGRAIDLLINRLLLGVMPYHALLCFKRPGGQR